MKQVVHAACPHDCPDTCGVLVTIEDGRATKIQGDPEHRVTRGFLCAKVAKYLDRVYSAVRVLYPMRRAKPKGPVAKIPTLRQTQGRLSGAKDAREMGHPQFTPQSRSFAPGQPGAAVSTFSGPDFFDQTGARISWDEAMDEIATRLRAQPGVVSARLNWAKLTPGFQSINFLTSEKLTDMGNSATFYSVLVEVELTKPSP